MEVIISESKLTKVIYTYLTMSLEGFDNCSYDWANFNCGMGVCCDPYAIGFVLPESEYDDYLFKLVNGELYDAARWGNYYKPYGVEVPASAASPTLQQASTPAAKPASVVKPVVDNDVPFDTTPATTVDVSSIPAQAIGDGAKKSADDILAMIRNRKQA